MGLFDSYFDPEQFQDSGGLLGRLLSLQGQQGQYQPGAGDPPGAASGQTASAPQTLSLPVAPSTSPSAAPTPLAPPTPDYGQTQNMAVGNYQMPQFGGAGGPQAALPPPDLGDRLSAGFQSFAHTPVGNPFAAIANGVTGFSAGQRTDAAGFLPAQTASPASGQSPDPGDRVIAGVQSFAHTPAGNPFAALANGIAALSSGQRTDPAGIAQQNLQPGTTDPAAGSQDLNARYQALRPVLGDRNAMLVIVHPEVGQSLMAQALARQPKAGSTGADAAGGDRPGVAGQTNPAGNGPSPGPVALVTSKNAGANSSATLQRKRGVNFHS